MTEWQSVPHESAERSSDALDRAIANIARAHKEMRKRDVRCSESIFKRLRREFLDCLEKSESLSADERMDVNEILARDLLEGSLVDLLNDVLAERSNPKSIPATEGVTNHDS
jgi:hypothetical protein